MAVLYFNFPQNGFTSLMIASQNGYKEVVSALLRGGANTDTQEEVSMYYLWKYNEYVSPHC